MFSIFKLTFYVLGITASFTSLPASTHTIYFFYRYRVFALALVTCVLPLGFLIFPPVVTLLLERFGWREANMFIAAINLQVANENTITLFEAWGVKAIRVNTLLITHELIFHHKDTHSMWSFEWLPGHKNSGYTGIHYLVCKSERSRFAG